MEKVPMGGKAVVRLSPAPETEKNAKHPTLWEKVKKLFRKSQK